MPSHIHHRVRAARRSAGKAWVLDTQQFTRTVHNLLQPGDAAISELTASVLTALKSVPAGSKVALVPALPLTKEKQKGSDLAQQQQQDITQPTMTAQQQLTDISSNGTLHRLIDTFNSTLMLLNLAMLPNSVRQQDAASCCDMALLEVVSAKSLAIHELVHQVCLSSKECASMSNIIGEQACIHWLSNLMQLQQQLLITPPEIESFQSVLSRECWSMQLAVLKLQPAECASPFVEQGDHLHSMFALFN